MSRPTASSRLVFSSPWRQRSEANTAAFDRSLAFFSFVSTMPTRMFVPPMSTARMRVVALQHPRRHQVGGADEAGLVRMVLDELQFDLVVVGFQQHLGAPDRQLADAARAKAAADDDGLGIFPARSLDEALDHRRESLGELFDGAVDDAAGFRIAFGQQLVELLLRHLVGRLLAERIGAELAQRLAPFLQHLVKGAAARLVADETVLVLDLEVVAVDLDARQPFGTVRIENLTLVCGHNAHRSPLRLEAAPSGCRTVR